MADQTNEIARRKALQLLGVGLAAGGLVLAGCKEEAAKPVPQAAPPAPPPPAPKPAEPVAAAKPPEPEVKPAEPAANPAPEATGGCKDKAPIDDASKSLRRALQYKEKADAPEKACKGCVQFEAGKYAECGGCKLFTGAVSPEGSCLSFAPLAVK